MINAARVALVFALVVAGVLADVAFAGEARAQRFSATARRVIVEGEGPTDIFMSRRVRLWSEDGANYRLSFAGCEFAVGPDELPPSARAPPTHLTLEYPTHFEGHLGGARRVDIGRP